MSHLDSFTLLKQFCYFQNTLLTLCQILCLFHLLINQYVLYKIFALFQEIIMLNRNPPQLNTDLSPSTFFFFCQFSEFLKFIARNFCKHWSREIRPTVISLQILLLWIDFNELICKSSLILTPSQLSTHFLTLLTIRLLTTWFLFYY